MARSTLERFPRSTLESTHHTVPCGSRAGELAPRALAKAFRGLGGCGCGGSPIAGVAGTLGMGLGREAMACTTPACTPRLAADGSNPPHLHDRRPRWRPGLGPPRTLHPPQSQRLPVVGDKPPVARPPLSHLGGETVELGQLKHLHHLFRGGGSLPPLPPRQLLLPPPLPKNNPHPHGLVPVDASPPLGVGQYPLPLPLNSLIHTVH